MVPDRLLEQPQAINGVSQKINSEPNLVSSDEIKSKRELKNIKQNNKGQSLEIKQLNKTNGSAEAKRKRGRPKKNSQPEIEAKQKAANVSKKQKSDPLTIFRSIF